jgi:hypothetical protein
MKIKVDSAYICDGADRATDKWCGPLMPFERTVRDLEEPIASLRATAKLIIDRQNVHNELLLRVTRPYSSIGAAYAAQVALTSLAGVITFETGSGNYAMTGKAKLMSVRARGARLNVDWLLIGGAITTV